jgi:hypothetical protein
MVPTLSHGVTEAGPGPIHTHSVHPHTSMSPPTPHHPGVCQPPYRHYVAVGSRTCSEIRVMWTRFVVHGMRSTSESHDLELMFINIHDSSDHMFEKRAISLWISSTNARSTRGWEKVGALPPPSSDSVAETISLMI